MKKILLLGNPNVGKSAVFNRLTGVEVIISNYPGTTVEFTKGSLVSGSENYEVIDIPGCYTIDPTCKAEEVASRMLQENPDAILLNVLPATHLERNLFLTLQIAEKRMKTVIALNMWDEAGHEGIKIVKERLESILGVSYIPTCGVSGEGIRELVEALPGARVPVIASESESRWKMIGDIVSRVQCLHHRHHSLGDYFADMAVQPTSGLVLAVFVMLASFFVIRQIGEVLIELVFSPIFAFVWNPMMTWVSVRLGGRGALHDVLIGHLIDGKIDFGQSFGLLTTGLNVSLGQVMPYVFAFYLVLSILEDTGYLPRLAVILDVLMHRFGLHGLSIIPMILGLGCNVPGLLSTRILETRRERFIVAAMTSIGIPCISMQAMIFGLVGKHGPVALLLVFGTLGMVWFLLGILLKRLIPGDAQELFIEIPPLRIPNYWVLSRKL